MKLHKRGGISFRGFLIAIIIISIFVMIFNLLVYNYYLRFAKPISGASNTAELSFTVEATASGGGGAGGGGGGGAGGSAGGGGGITKKKVLYDFELDQALIKVSSKVGESFKRSLSIKNNNDVSLNFQISTNLKDIVFISEESFDIPAHSEKTIFLTFVASEDLKPDVYTGKVLFKTQYSEKELSVIYEVRSKKSLFDVSLNIPAKYKTLKSGDDLFFQVTIFNLGEIGEVDVEVEYDVKDFEGNVITTLTEIVAVGTQVSFSKVIDLPENIALGDYVVSAKVKYGLTVATASDLFSIFEKGFILLSPKYQTAFITGILIFVIIVAIVIIIYENRRRKLKSVVANQNKKLLKVYERVNSGKVKSDEINPEINKLSSQMALLEEAYRKGYIKKESYQIGKEKIDILIRRLKKRL